MCSLFLVALDLMPTWLTAKAESIIVIPAKRRNRQGTVLLAHAAQQTQRKTTFSFSMRRNGSCRSSPDGIVVSRQRSISSRTNSARRLAERRRLGQAARLAQQQVAPPDRGLRPLDRVARAALAEAAAVVAPELPKDGVAVAAAEQILTLVVGHSNALWLRDLSSWSS